MSTLTPNKWTIFEPSVIRDAISGRLGFQEDFGTTYVSGATQALALVQNPLDAPSAAGDAVLYVGTTNGGLYKRHYEYSTDTWSDQWTWLSQPSTGGSDFTGNQGIGSMAISPDASLIAVGRGNSSNYNYYTPNGQALQFGQLKADGSIDWLPTPAPELLAGLPETGNIRSMVWNDDGLYISTAGGASTATFQGHVYLLKVDATGALSEPIKEIKQYSLPLPAGGLTDASDAVYFSVAAEGIFNADANGQATLINSQSSGWTTLWQTRLTSNEVIGRITAAVDPDNPDGRILLVGWYKYPGTDITKGYISHVDRLTLNSSNEVMQVTSLDFSDQAGSGQAATTIFFGNYSLAFDLSDPTLNTIFVGGNQYASKHPEDATPYSFTGGLIRGVFGQDGLTAVFGPYANSIGTLVPESIAIGAPHADSRSIVYLQTQAGPRIIQSDDGGVWQLQPADEDPAQVSWTSLNAIGLHSLETLSSAWDARSNTLLQAFQDNAVSMAQPDATYLSNIWQGDGNLALVDGALANDGNASVWAYLNSQQYMLAGSVVGMALNDSGRINNLQTLTLTTNVDGSSVQPVALVERYALLYAGQAADAAPFSFPAVVNPYRPGDVALAGSSGLYETFIPNWSDYAQANAIGTLQVLPLIPFDTANRSVTAISLGSLAADQSGQPVPKPFFWDAMVAATWDGTKQQSIIWYRNAVSLDEAPRTLADVDQAFLGQIGLTAATTSNRIISDLTHQADSEGKVTGLYYLESAGSLRYLNNLASVASLYPQGDDPGAALVIVQDDTVTRLPYAQTEGLDQLVRASDNYGPTSIELLPARDGLPAQLVVGGEHGLYVSDLNDTGIPTGFTPMSIDGLPDGVQYGAAIMELTYSVDDDLLIASVLGGGSFLYSRSGEIGETPSGSTALSVSQTAVPQNLAESLDKRGNPVNGNFAIELPASAFNDQGIAKANFIIEDVPLWQKHLAGVSLYQSIAGDFNLLDTDQISIREEVTFNDFASLRIGTFRTNSTAQELPTVVLPYAVELLDAAGDVIETVQASIDLLPNGTTPSFMNYTAFLPSGRSIFEARFGFGDGINFQKLPFDIKVALPTGLPENTELFAFKVDGLNGVIRLDGQDYAPGQDGYTEAALASRLDTNVDLSAGPMTDNTGLNIEDLTTLFSGGSASAYLATEGQFFGKALTVNMPELYGSGNENSPPLVGIGVLYPDASVALTTVDATQYDGNVINFNPENANQGITIDVGYGGIFACQQDGGEITVAKLGQMSSATGFFRVDDLFGTIDGLAPGDVGYAEAALERSLAEDLDLTLTQGFGTTQTYDLAGFIEGCYYASYITRHTSTVEEALENLRESLLPSSEYVLFSLDEANPGSNGQNQSAAIPFAADLIAFEDMPLGGDMDFNDLAIYYGSLV